MYAERRPAKPMQCKSLCGVWISDENDDDDDDDDSSRDAADHQLVFDILRRGISINAHKQCI